MPPLRTGMVSSRRATARVAPTANQEAESSFRRGRSKTGPSYLGTREGQIPIPFVSLRSTSPLDKGSRPLPYGSQGLLPGLGRGGPWASRRGSCKPRRHPHPPPSGAPSPLEGEGLRAADSRPYKENRNPIPYLARATARVAPTAYPAPGALVRETQAQFLNRTSGNFCKPRAQWPGRKRGGHSIFARRKFSNIKQESVPRNGVRGKATMSTKCSSEPSPVAFCLLCCHGQSRSPPVGGETPARKVLYPRSAHRTSETPSRKP